MATTKTTMPAQDGAAPDQPKITDPGKDRTRPPAFPAQDPSVRKPQTGGNKSDSRTKGR